MTTLSLTQTLHGYDDGHRLLAVGGPHTEALLRAADCLSDLSGYIPVGMPEFGVYHTGYPVSGGLYAVAATWLDRSPGRRSGTVLTHTVYVPAAVLGQIHDPTALPFREPASARDVRSYREPATWTVTPTAPLPHRSWTALEVADALIDGAWERRSILWVGDVPAVRPMLAWWSMLYPSCRGTVAWCTWALNWRFVGDKTFDFLGTSTECLRRFQGRSYQRAPKRPQPFW